jgi:hypothetical protein
MDYLKEGIGLRAMAQRDPLVEYQLEGYDMFVRMLEAVKEECGPLQPGRKPWFRFVLRLGENRGERPYTRFGLAAILDMCRLARFADPPLMAVRPNRLVWCIPPNNATREK